MTEQYDGETTIKQPPHSPTFDLTNRAPSLLPGGRGVPTSSSGSSDLAAVTTILNTLSNSTHSSHPPAPLPTELPPPALPVITTLTSLNRFLAHCQKDLGILGALDYESPLRRHAYGPDILHKVELETLESLGIPAGNAIRLKDASQPWITDHWRNGNIESHHQNVSQSGHQRSNTWLNMRSGGIMMQEMRVDQAVSQPQ